jgi:hypothetical protein
MPKYRAQIVAVDSPRANIQYVYPALLFYLFLLTFQVRTDFTDPAIFAVKATVKAQKAPVVPGKLYFTRYRCILD